MRIERSGDVAKLTPRLESFFKEALGGEDLDDLQHAEARKADFRCLNGLLTIELKSLEDSASERIDNLTDELRQQPDWPVFLGSVPFNAVLPHVQNPDEVRHRMIERIGRAIKGHIRKANKQLAAHETDFPRKNMVKVMVLANEDHEVYDPDLVGHVVHGLLTRKNGDQPLYPHIDAVMYFTERHAAAIHGQVSFPIVCVEGYGLHTQPWKRCVTEHFLARWGEWSGTALYTAAYKEHQYATIEPVPERMRRYERWELDYRRNCYMQGYTDEQVRERLDEALCIQRLAFVKSAPIKPDRDIVAWSLEMVSHLKLEMGWRSIPMTQFRIEPMRLAAAARRLGFPSQAVVWLAGGCGRAA